MMNAIERPLVPRTNDVRWYFVFFFISICYLVDSFINSIVVSGSAPTQTYMVQLKGGQESVNSMENCNHWTYSALTFSFFPDELFSAASLLQSISICRQWTLHVSNLMRKKDQWKCENIYGIEKQSGICRTRQ